MDEVEPREHGDGREPDDDEPAVAPQDGGRDQASGDAGAVARLGPRPRPRPRRPPRRAPRNREAAGSAPSARPCASRRLPSTSPGIGSSGTPEGATTEGATTTWRAGDASRER